MVLFWAAYLVLVTCDCPRTIIVGMSAHMLSSGSLALRCLRSYDPSACTGWCRLHPPLNLCWGAGEE